MKKYTLVPVFLFLNFLVSPASADSNERFSSGIGFGNYYAGMGANIGLTRHDSFTYLSLGCPGITGSSQSGVVAACGGGIGWVTTKLIPQEKNRHAVGLYAGILGGEIIKIENSKSQTKTTYGLGVNYSYFFNGLNKNGWNVGFVIGWGESKTKGLGVNEVKLELSGMPNLGYQLMF